ncbi:primosomal protein N' [Streptococcus ictaluri]|uniref:Replication restart protein PriA n=1 Tax=Streptococcus ictaluri 707-05 TaxID=764299 RepID=G5K4G8_9STRE|nr:primosomal protein N' [Streptococcus ictaluri]EHI69283.1 primosomal protein N' [Streptococcus ictaluri 707-05]
MQQIAQIIVDIPLMQTDKPFSYKVPEELQELVKVGSRVHVPFGKGNRLLQGFILALEDSEDRLQELKSIQSVLDAEPVLNQEQLDLADQLRKTVFSYKVTLLKAMIPSLLNSNYDKELVPAESIDPELKELLFGHKESIRFSNLTEEEAKLALKAIQAKKVAVSYIAEDKKRIKTQKYFSVNKEQLVEHSISKRAKKRQALKDYLLANSEDGKLSELHHLFSREIVSYFKEHGLITIWEKQINRSDDYFKHVDSTKALELNDEQAKAVDKVVSAIGRPSKPFLIEGITGSGKTEVYLHIIDVVLKKEKTAIVLVPEISLTPQMTQRFIARFGKQVAIMHSGLSDGEKFDEWQKIKKGQARVVVGARSAIFAPLRDIGAIIIDEEHESTYKQESNPRYHAREVALLRARHHQAVLVMGSATPSIESRARASKGVYHFIQLTQRANPKAQIPQVEIVDFRDYIGQQSSGNYTPYLIDKIKERLRKKEQTVLMLNRRGYSSFMMCRDCGYVDQCPNCDISLTLHMDSKSMNCHYCGFQKAIPQTCPSCHSKSIRYYGTGTQKAYDELQELIPEARILRMDVDTTRQKGSHESILREFGDGKADILLGTQMIAKGLDFPNVTLVGVLNADTSLNLPDFRSSEKTFQLLTQVAGRAGRAHKPGEVLIQTYNPEHYAIQLAKKQDYEAFYAYEMTIRRRMAYPPYYFTVGLTLSHRSEQEVAKKSYEVLALLKDGLSSNIKILGPTPKPIARTHNLFHYQIILKYRFEDHLVDTLNLILDWSQDADNRELKVVIDQEPQQFM